MENIKHKKYEKMRVGVNDKKTKYIKIHTSKKHKKEEYGSSEKNNQRNK